MCIDTACSLGFCAEHAAAAAVVTAGESRVVKMIAVGADGRILAPCGRCREFISQLHPGNGDAEVMVAPGTVVQLNELFPYDWKAPGIPSWLCLRQTFRSNTLATIMDAPYESPVMEVKPGPALVVGWK